jgi:4-hydroxybenzoyl-CoA reductase subunit beta
LYSDRLKRREKQKGKRIFPMLKGSLSYEAPESLDQAVNTLMTGDNITLLAGGTDLVSLIKYGVKKPSSLLDLKKIRSLKSIALRDEGLRIGSMVTLTEIANHPGVNTYFPALAQSARSVASPQIRNVATVGGNLFQERRCLYFNQSEYWRKNVPACFKLEGEVCHQVPGSDTCRALYYSDTAPVLLAFDARAELYDGGNFRTIPLREMIRRHVTGEDKKLLLTGILLPVPPDGTWGRFMKQSLRAAIDFAMVNVALRLSPPFPEDTRAPVVNIFVGAISPEPVELTETAENLISNFSKCSSLQGEIKEQARKEVIRKSALIRETGVSLKSKRNALDIVSNVLGELFTSLATR